MTSRRLKSPRVYASSLILTTETPLKLRISGPLQGETTTKNKVLYYWPFVRGIPHDTIVPICPLFHIPSTSELWLPLWNLNDLKAIGDLVVFKSLKYPKGNFTNMIESF